MKPSPRLTFVILTAFAIVFGYFLGSSSWSPSSPSTKSHRSVSSKSAGFVDAGHSMADTTHQMQTAPRTWTVLETSSWNLRAVSPLRLTRHTPQVQEGSASVDDKALPDLEAATEGERVRFILGEEGTYEGVIHFSKPGMDGAHRVAGELDGKVGGFAFVVRSRFLAGDIFMPARNVRYVLDSTKALMTKEQLNKSLCMALPAPDDQHPVPREVLEAAVAPTVPALDSSPAATAVILLDFDGESVLDPIWGYGKPLTVKPAIVALKPITSAQITDVWARVAEDFRPFAVSVTTITARYTSAPIGKRMRCIITPTSYFAENPYFTTNLGGAGWRGTFAQNANMPAAAPNDTPCFVFVTSDTAHIARAVSHELGHTLSLWHQGEFFVDAYGYWDFTTYSNGHGYTATSWAPIMGLPYGRNVVQWSKSEQLNGSTENYTGSASFYYVDPQDDISIIKQNGLVLAPDEDGNSALTAASAGTSGKIDVQGVIRSETDDDYWRFDTSGGAVSVSAVPAGVDPNLDIELQLIDPDGTTVLATSNPLEALNASVAKTVPAGTYYVLVRGTGKGDPALTGYSRYGSLGLYRLTGTFVQSPNAPVISIQPMASTFPQGSTATLSVGVQANVAVTYQWQRQNPDTSFSNVAGKTAATLSFPNAQFVNEGVYRVVVTNTRGGPPLPSVTSSAVLLTIHSKPGITTQPSAIMVAAGTSTPVIVSIAASGSPTLHYQWQKDGANVGTDSASLTINNPQFQDGAGYRCVVSNAYGSATSNTAKLTVTSAPIITVPPPASQSIPLGGTATITATVIGSPTLAFQWFKDGTKITGATKSALTLAAIKATAAGTYRLEVKNGFVTTSVVSNDCVVTVLNPPIITTHPLPVTLGTGAPLTLVSAATGEPMLNYQWQHDNVNIPGATADTYQVAAAGWTDRGNYKVIVTNAVGTAISKTALVTMQSVPVITTPPVATLRIARGGKGTLSVVAEGSAPLTYQWQKNPGAGFVDVPGAKAVSLVIPGADANAAIYRVVVKNNFSTLTSTSTSVIIEDAPKIATHPASQTKPINADVTFSVGLYAGTAPLTYQWQRNGVNLSGETNPTLSLTNLQTANAGSYRVIIANNVGTVTSNAAVLTMLAGPSISVPPADLMVNAYEAATFSVVASGSPTLKYQWFKDNAVIPGATASTYKIASAQITHNGSYTVIVSNAAASTTSSPAILTVNPVTIATLGLTYPSQGMTEQLVLVNGTNLNWTLSVSMMKTVSASIPCTFKILSPTQLLVTVPKGAITSNIKVVTRAGTVSTASPFTVTTSWVNDTPAQAVIIPPTAEATMRGYNVDFTYYDPSDPLVDPSSSFVAYHSAWYRFTPASSGVYYISYGGYYLPSGGIDYQQCDLRIGIFLGNPLTAPLTGANSVASNRFINNRPLDATQSYDENQFLLSGYSESFAFYGAAGQTYWIMIGSMSFTRNGYFYDFSGPFDFFLHRNPQQ